MFEQGEGTVARLRNRIAELEALISPGRGDSLPLTEIISKQGKRIMELETCVEALLGTAQPWPLADTLKKLAVATQHLLNDHNCDCAGYEAFIRATNVSGYYIAKIRELHGAVLTQE